MESVEPANNRAKPPGISLLVICVISLLYILFELGKDAFRYFTGVPILPDNQFAESMGESGVMMFRLIFYALFFAIHGLIICGARAMIIRGDYRLSMTAAILAMIPCLSPCIVLGFPFGLWALLVLMQEDVKSTFQRVTNAEPTTKPMESPQQRRKRKLMDLSNWVSYPGTGLLILSGLSLVVYGFCLAFALFGFFSLFSSELSKSEMSAELLQVGIALAFFGILSLIQTIIVSGSLGMTTLRSYRLSVTAMILAMIPGFSPFFLLGIPLGIWGITLLCIEDIRDGFDR